MNEVHGALMSAAEASARRRFAVRRVAAIAGGTLKGAGRGALKAARATTVRSGIADIMDGAISGGEQGFRNARRNAQSVYEGAMPLWNRSADVSLAGDALKTKKDAKALFVGFIKYRQDGGMLAYPDYIEAITGSRHINPGQAKRANMALAWAEAELAPKPAPASRAAPKAPAINEAEVMKKLARAASDYGVTVEEMFRDLSPKEARDHLSQHGLSRGEIDFAMNRHSKEIIQGFESNIKGKNDVELKNRIERNGADWGVEWLNKEGYTAETAKILVEKHYQPQIHNFKLAQSDLFKLFSPLRQDVQDSVLISHSALRMLLRNEAIANSFNKTIPEITNALQTLGNRSLGELKVTSSTHEGNNIYNIDLIGGARAIYFIEKGQVYVTDIFPSGQKKQYEKKLNQMLKKHQTAEDHTTTKSISDLLKKKRAEIISET